MPIRVLLADPDESVLESYHAFLSRQGFEIRAVTTSQACIEALRDFGPHVLVLEPERPGGWGTDILDYLRTVDALPVIVLTRHDIELTGVPVHAHYVKPYSMFDLSAGIRGAASAVTG
jgi:DNA-binding response OmpR family regulator